LDSVVTANSATRGAGGVGIGGPAPDGLPGSGYGGGIFIAGAQVGIDKFTLAHVTGNSASTSHPNIDGEFDVIADPNPLSGDYNNNGTVDAGDYVVWRKTDGSPAAYDTWRAHFGKTSGSGAVATGFASASADLDPAPGETGLRVPAATVPEPTTLAIFTLATFSASLSFGRRKRTL
jgi:hypothetical protein